MVVWSSGLKRFIRYLYEYEKDKRIRNVGFIKIETGCEETIVHLQAKGFHDREKLVLYLFYVENDRVFGILQDEIYLTSPVLSWHHTFSAGNVGGEAVYRKICGVLVETGSGQRMAATWEDRRVDVSKMEMFVAESPSVNDESGYSAWESGDLHHATENPGREEEKEGEDSSEEEDGAPQETLEVEKPLCKCKKISRQDLSKLPRCEWKLANNKFLMHGYNNFHHLLLIDDGNHLKLGVPGIYHIEEAKCADAFGFGEFISADEQEKFGYWCRPVRGRINMIEEKI